MTRSNALRLAVAFLAGVVATAILGSIVQTQINLAALGSLGAPLTPVIRLSVTGQDLLRFGPVMAAIAAAAFAPAFPVAALVASPTPRVRPLVFALAGFTGLLTAFWAMGFFTPMPTLVAAVRGLPGLLAMSATGLAGGLVFALLSARLLHRRGGPMPTTVAA